MRKSTYLTLLSLGALTLTGHVYAAATSFVADESTEGMTWTTVDWSNGVPGSTDTATVSIGDSINPLLVDGAQVIGNATLNGSTYLLIDGEGNSITTTLTGTGGYGDVNLNGNSILEVRNGASLTIANGMSLKGFGNSSVLFDNATFTGKFNNTMHSAVFQNGSQVNLTGVDLPNAFNILVKDSTITSAGDVKFVKGSTDSSQKIFTVDNSTWALNGKGFNASGIINLVNGSSAKNTPHFNLGYEGGASGENILTVQGTADKTAEIQGSALWVNSGAGATTSLVLAGNTDAKFGNVNSGSGFTSSKEVSIKLEGTKNVFAANDWTNFANNRSDGKSTSGNWLITTAKTVDGVEVLASDSSMKFNQFAFAGSKDASKPSSINALIDWAGAGNTFTVNGNLAINGDMASGGTSQKSIVVRDGASFTVTSGTYLGSESKTGTLSGNSELIVKGTDSVFNTNGLSLRNSDASNSDIYNYVKFENGATVKTGAINIATDSTSKSGVSVVEISGATTTVDRGDINIGNSGATGGEAWLKYSNGIALTGWNNTAINAGNNTTGAKFGIILDGSSLKSSWNMGAGSQSKYFILQNGSTWNGNNAGISIAGNVEVYDTSKIENVVYFNIGAENGGATGFNKLYMRGTDAEHKATASGANLWLNTKENSESIIYQDGNTNISISNNINIGNNNTASEYMSWIMQGANNSVSLGSGTWGWSGHNSNTTGLWLLTTAQTIDGVETFATNSNFNARGNIAVRGSDVKDSTFQSKIDWAGVTNTFSANDLNVYSSKGSENTKVSATFRNSSTADLSGSLRIGHGDMLSGTAEVAVKSGAVLNQKNNLIIQNAKNADATVSNYLLIDNAKINRTGGDLRIGVTDDGWQHAVAGESVVEIKNSEFTYTGGILLAASDAKLSDGVPLAKYSNVSKLIVDSSKLTLTGEVYMGHNSTNGGTIYGGSSYIILKGNDASFITTNKTLYSGYNTTFYGGDRHIEIEGTNNTMKWSSTENFMMSTANGVKQYGGSFDIKLTGEGNSFGGRNILIGATNATAGYNKFYSNGDSSANKNQVLLTDGGYLVELRGSTVATSTIANTFELAGNTIVKRDVVGGVNFNIGNSAMAGGTAQFIISGENNEVVANTMTLGNNSSTGGKALFKVDGSTHDINFASYLSFQGSKDTSELAFVADANGISTINVNYVDSFKGLLTLDFSKFSISEGDTVDFELITSDGTLNNDAYLITSEDVSDIVKVQLANEGDTWRLFNDRVGDKNVFKISYTAVPEPSTYAMIFGALAIALVAYRRRK